MKKIKLLTIGLLVALLVCSCEDTTGDYVEQLYTDAQKKEVVTACLTSSLDSAFAHLCVYNGFYQYNEGTYRIDFSQLQSSVFDTLQQHQKGYLVDSLILYSNRMAESCNASVIGEIFKERINNTSFPQADDLIHGNSTAITDYFVQVNEVSIKEAMRSPVSIRMNVFRVNEYWTQVINQYNEYASTPVNIDLQDYIISKMLSGIFEEMRVEEYNIRLDSTHRAGADTILSLQ